LALFVGVVLRPEPIDARTVYALNIDISGGSPLPKPGSRTALDVHYLKSTSQPLGLRRQTVRHVRGAPTADIPMAALWPVNHKVEENCGSKADG
jgi:hypothetical protein